MTPVKLPFSPCPLRELYLIEYSEGLKTLGQLWVEMVEAQVDYSAARQYIDRSEGYAAGQVVIYRGTYRVAATTTTDDPSNATVWKEAPKFVGECAEVYADLYCNFVGPYLAYTVLAERFPYLVTQLGDQGVTYGGRNYNIQDKALMDSLLRAVYRDKSKVKTVLDHYLNSTDSKCIQSYPGLGSSDRSCTCSGQCSKCSSSAKPKQSRHENIGRTRWG
jgi:hypothetical protein